MSSFSVSRISIKSLFSLLILSLLALSGLGGCGGSSSKEDPIPSVSVAAASVLEGDSGTPTLDFVVTTSKASSSVITLTYSITPGTATAGTDYTDNPGPIDIPANATNVTISVPIIVDTDVEEDETLTLTLTAASGASLGTATVTGTILNDDDADPKGYYTGTASVKQADNTSDLNIGDLHGMVSGNRMMIMSEEQHVLLYDAVITSISGSRYTASVDIYKDGTFEAATTLSGSIVPASSITGTLAGEGAGNGSFTLTYSQNNSDSALSRIEGEWNLFLNKTDTTFGDSLMTINSVGEISLDISIQGSTPTIGGCNFTSSTVVAPIAGVNIYGLSLTLAGCNDSDVNGEYTGFMTTTNVMDDEVVVTFSNGVYSGRGAAPRT